MAGYEYRSIAPDQLPTGRLPMVSQGHPAEARLVGAGIECPFCRDEVCPTYVHPVDSRSETRGSVYGSDSRFVVNILLGCEHGNHYFVLEVTNRKGEFNMGLRAPYDRELVSEWVSGSFDNSVLAHSVRFSESFEVPA